MALAFRAFLILASLSLPVIGGSPTFAQDASVSFGGIRQDPSLPVEVTSETLSVDQNGNTAVFTGNVVVIQGDMRMTAPRVKVEYGANGEGIQKVYGYEDVLLVTPTDAAESLNAVYTVASGDIVMTDSVALTQGGAVITGDKLTANLTSGTGLMSGNVKTVFQPSKQQ